MKNYTITEEQIKTIEADGINYIKEWFPEVFESELKIDTWYKFISTNNEYLLFFEGEEHCYGFYNNSWGHSWSFSKYNQRIALGNEATDEEVEEALIKEAKKRGYTTENTESLTIGRTQLIDYESEKADINGQFHFDGDSLFSAPEGCGGKILFHKGKWAETKKDPITLTFNEIAEKFGIDVNLLRITKL